MLDSDSRLSHPCQFLGPLGSSWLDIVGQPTEVRVHSLQAKLATFANP